MEKRQFKKSYSRDCSIILEEAWFEAQTKNFAQLFSENNPFGVPNVYYVENGVLEIWENERAIDWNKNKLLQQINKDANFINQVVEKYKLAYAKLEQYWSENDLTLDRLTKYIEDFKSAVNLFAVIYFVMINEDAPEDVRQMLREIREGDNLMDGSDVYIRKTLSSNIPQIEDVEAVIKTSEVENLKVTKEELHWRRLHWVVIPEVKYFVGKLSDFENSKIEYKFESEVVELVREIKGQVAFKGVVQGVVRIIRRKDQVALVEVGEIIVSPMTISDFLPAMKLAAAFVTDEGGITCHAAIVAREFKKPCIIGTKIATQVLKDGDLVEVDADYGVVRILS